MCTEDTTIDGMFVPKGCAVDLFFHGAHLDKNNWEAPYLFMPERWETANATKHAFSFVPFSAAERNCIGQKLAVQESQIMLALLVKNLRVLPACDLNDVKMGHEVLMVPKNLFVKFESRE